MKITPEEINYNFSILEKTLDSPQAKELDIGFIEIFANDIQDLQTVNFDKKKIHEVSLRLHTIAARIYDASGKAIFSPVDPDAHRPLVGKQKPLSELANEYSEGVVRTGLEALAPHFLLTPIAGDGHCLFRSITAGILRWMQTAPQNDQELFFNTLDKQVEKLSDPILSTQYRALQKVILDLAEKRTTIDEVLSQKSTSNQLVQFLRTLATSYNMAHGNETFQEECILEAGSKQQYGVNMVDMEQSKMGGQAEYTALEKALGISVQIVDAMQIGKKTLTLQASLDAQKANTIALLYRPGHYDLLTFV